MTGDLQVGPTPQPPGQARNEDPAAGGEPAAGLNPEHLLQAFGLAESHYTMDLQLFSVRMSLFLLVQTGLVAAASSTVLKGQSSTYGGAISVFGSILAFIWLLVACSSYYWIKTWRWHLFNLGRYLNKDLTGYPDDKAAEGFNPEDRKIIIFSLLFHRDHIGSAHPLKLHCDPPEHSPKLTISERFLYYVRPTLITCCLPVLFIGGWIYIGFHAHWSGI